ncbi:MAG: lipoprotein signal peptidase, partial [Actinomycetota bacterium]
AYGLLLAGALGNAIDRLVRAGGPGFGRGYVVDFVAWGGFPRFNVADSAITIGFLLLVVALWLDERAAGSAQRVDGADVEVGAGAAGDEGAGGVAVTGS